MYICVCQIPRVCQIPHVWQNRASSGFLGYFSGKNSETNFYTFWSWMSVPISGGIVELKDTEY